MSAKRQQVGRRGEEIAERYLKQNGYRIIIKNFRGRTGEIDLIASHGDLLIFVEVKTRTNTTFGNPAHAVTTRKQGQISKAAMEYLSRERKQEHPARFDVITIILQGADQPAVEHIIDAFELQYHG